MIRNFCKENELKAPERKAMRYIFKRRLYDSLCTRQRGAKEPVYVSPKFYEGAAPFGLDIATEMMDELLAEGVLIRREEDGLYALSNWADFRFDFSI